MINRYFTITNFLLVTVGVYLCVNVFYTIVTAQLDYDLSTGVKPNQAPASKVERSHSPLAVYDAIKKRNIFNTNTEKAAPVAEKKVVITSYSIHYTKLYER